MIIILFFGGFLLGLIFTLIGEELPLLLPEVKEPKNNSWILNLFIACLNALIVLISFYYYGFSYEFFLSLIVTALIIIIFITDFKYMIILDSPLLIAGILTLILKAYYFDFKTMLLSLGSGLLLFGFMLLIGFLGKLIFKRDAIGGGDIKLAIVMGIILNFRLGILAIIFSSLLALPYAIATIMLGKNKEVPFGPFLVGSMGIVYLFSAKFLNLISFLF